MLEINDLHVHYGVVHAIKGVSLTVNEGEIVCLIGANGAGKTTILQTVTGLKKASGGQVMLNGQDLLATEPSKIIRAGLSHVPEGRRIFTQMTVEENLQMGAYIRRDKAAIHKDIERVYSSFPRLRERAKQIAGTLSGGEQQMLAIGRAMLSNPKILLLDEPSMGLSPLLVAEVFKIIETLNKSGITILLVEQNAMMALSIANRGYVLETGKIVMTGAAADLLRDENVKRAYLGA